MANESIISATCSVQHDRRLFRLHNDLVDRPMLGDGVRGPSALTRLPALAQRRNWQPRRALCPGVAVK